MVAGRIPEYIYTHQCSCFAHNKWAKKEIRKQQQRLIKAFFSERDRKHVDPLWVRMLALPIKEAKIYVIQPSQPQKANSWGSHSLNHKLDQY